MADIEAAVDERGANIVMHHAQAALGVLHKTGSGSLGAFHTNWNASASFKGGSVDLIPSKTIRLKDFEMHWSVNASVVIDLNKILQPIKISPPCITFKIFKKTYKICPPSFTIHFPTVTIPVGHSDVMKLTADFELGAFLDAADYWNVTAKILGVPSLQLGPGSAALLVALGLAASAVLAPIPFIGPFLAGAVVVITATIGIAGMTGFLGTILSQFVTGLTFLITREPRIFTLLAASSPIDPAVMMRFNELRASIVGTDEDELLIQTDLAVV